MTSAPALPFVVTTVHVLSCCRRTSRRADADAACPAAAGGAGRTTERREERGRVSLRLCVRQRRRHTRAAVCRHLEQVGGIRAAAPPRGPRREMRGVRLRRDLRRSPRACLRGDGFISGRGTVLFVSSRSGYGPAEGGHERRVWCGCNRWRWSCPPSGGGGAS